MAEATSNLKLQDFDSNVTVVLEAERMEPDVDFCKHCGASKLRLLADVALRPQRMGVVQDVAVQTDCVEYTAVQNIAVPQTHDYIKQFPNFALDSVFYGTLDLLEHSYAFPQLETVENTNTTFLSQPIQNLDKYLTENSENTLLADSVLEEYVQDLNACDFLHTIAETASVDFENILDNYEFENSCNNVAENVELSNVSHAEVEERGQLLHNLNSLRKRKQRKSIAKRRKIAVDGWWREPKPKLRHACDVCLRSFSRKTGLKEHKRTHSAEKLLQCPLCPKTFKCNPELSRHKKTHVSKRPFACKVEGCGKTYTDHSGLHKHRIKVHQAAVGKTDTKIESVAVTENRRSVSQESSKVHELPIVSDQLLQKLHAYL